MNRTAIISKARKLLAMKKIESVSYSVVMVYDDEPVPPRTKGEKRFVVALHSECRDE